MIGSSFTDFAFVFLKGFGNLLSKSSNLLVLLLQASLCRQNAFQNNIFDVLPDRFLLYIAELLKILPKAGQRPL